MSTLSRHSKEILIADAGLGGLWKLNVVTKAYSLVITDPSMLGHMDDPISVGAESNKLHGSYLYYTGSNKGFVGRIPIWPSGFATGPAQHLTQSVEGLDDILVDSRGNVWFTQNYRNTVSVIPTDGTVVDAVGALDQITIGGPTACAFGRLGDALKNIYCSTNGAIWVPVNGTVSEGGKIVVVDLQDSYDDGDDGDDLHQEL
jgi:hypothetical protein